MKLTVKQKKFADEYVKSGNATQSAIKAGYSEKTAAVIGTENLIKPNIKTYIDERMKELESKRIMSATEAVQLLTSIARGEVKETVIVATPVGVETTEKEADLKTRITATKEILKRYPGSDKLAEQQLRKAIAEADILEAKAKELQGGGDNQDDMLRGIADSLGGVE
ncbi:Phage terminase [Fructobacillus tropaeoli]|uniref:terminase small subunit n=1 Tax=Fructobacillus tropaeoli TaxID=709323 RepID=UPI002D8F6436|nr:Phage terminase [Fructobacillus tropaeoli]